MKILKHIINKKDNTEYKKVNHNGTIKEFYYKDNRLHRLDGPAEIQYYKNGNVKEQYWYKDNIHHREDNQPATILYYPNGTVEFEFYYQNGKLHNPNGPSIIAYSLNNTIVYKAFYLNNKLTSINNKPTEIYYDKFGKAEKVIYCKKNKLHRLNGPAITIFDKYQIEQDYYISGNKLTELQYLIAKNSEEMI